MRLFVNHISTQLKKYFINFLILNAASPHNIEGFCCCWFLFFYDSCNMFSLVPEGQPFLVPFPPAYESFI